MCRCFDSRSEPSIDCAFFFSSRRRHTRCSRDWSSDVCSSDLVGKTALCVHVAHQLRDQFPHGQLYVDLHGIERPESLSPKEVLGRFLRALGVESPLDRKSTRLNSSHGYISYAVFCLKKKIDSALRLYKSSLPGRHRGTALRYSPADRAKARILSPRLFTMLNVICSSDYIIDSAIAPITYFHTDISRVAFSLPTRLHIQRPRNPEHPQLRIEEITTVCPSFLVIKNKTPSGHHYFFFFINPGPPEFSSFPPPDALPS